MDEHTTHWDASQVARLNQCIENGDVIAFWCSDKEGDPCNGGLSDTRAIPGVIMSLPVDKTNLCCHEALHGTTNPNRFLGERVWVCAFRKDVIFHSSTPDKLGALEREYIGEILPGEDIIPSVSMRLGRKNLAGASLANSHAKFMSFHGASFKDADLSNSRFIGCSMKYVDFRGANLTGVDFTNSCLFGALFDRGAFEKLGFEIDKEGYVTKKVPLYKQALNAFENMFAWGLDLRLKPI